jgi:hypothetical protein
MTDEHGQEAVIGGQAFEPAGKLPGDLDEALAARRNGEHMARLHHLGHGVLSLG